MTVEQILAGTPKTAQPVHPDFRALLNGTPGPLTNQEIASAPVGTPPPGIGFAGISAGSPAPPDTHIAVGPGAGCDGRIVEVTNNSTQIFDKLGNSISGPLGLDTMFANDVFDPKVLFDQHSGRFFIVALEIVWSGDRCDSPIAVSEIHLAVSDDATPDNLTTDWTFLTGNSLLVDDKGNATWADYPGIGADSDSLFITTNQFDQNCDFLFSNVRVFDKAQLLAGVYAFVDVSAGGNFTVQPAHTYGTTNTGGFYLVSRIGPLMHVVGTITGDPAAPSFSDVDVLLGYTGAFIGAGAVQAGSSVRLDTLSDRVQNAVWRNGSLYWTLTADIAPDNDADVVWLRADASNANIAYADAGYVDADGDAGGAWEYMPSVNANPADAMALCFTFSSANDFPGVYYALREAGDPAGTVGPPVAALVGPGFYHSFVVGACNDDDDCAGDIDCGDNGFCDREDRWGDYSACVVDPDNGCFWIANEYAATSVPAGSDWGTWIASFCVNNVAPVADCKDYAAVADADCCIEVSVEDINDCSFDPDGPGDIAQICIAAVDGNLTVDCPETVVVCGAGPHTVTLQIIDQEGEDSLCDATVTVLDQTPPTIECDATGGNVDDNCEYELPFSALVTDNCCVDVDDVNVQVELLTANATLGAPTVNKVPVSDKVVSVTGTVLVSDLTSCPATVRVTVTASDCTGNPATPCVREADVNDVTPPVITCPPDITLERGDKICNDDVQNWLDSASATDNCDTDVAITNDAPECGFACGTTTIVTFTATDDCGNVDQCQASITIKPCPVGTPSQKGTVLVFPNIEVKWNANGAVVKQDTFISLNNDQSEEVHLNLFFVNGDPNTPGEPGWNAQKVDIDLTANQPIFFSAATGEPFGVSGFKLLDPGPPPGRVDPEDPSGQTRVLRGFLVVVAVDPLGHEIRWNHLYGAATIVDYEKTRSWEYFPWAFQNRCVMEGEELLDCILFDANGVCCEAEVIPGNLDFDAFQLDFAPDRLLHNFIATNATAFTGGGRTVVHDTDLTLMVMNTDLRQDNNGPVTTKADFLVWNANEISFARSRCITCWDQTLFGAYGGIFLRANLQTDIGRFRVNGVASAQCLGSQPAALLGVANKVLNINSGSAHAFGGTHLQGNGTQNANMKFDPLPPPEESLNGGN